MRHNQIIEGFICSGELKNRELLEGLVYFAEHVDDLPENAQIVLEGVKELMTSPPSDWYSTAIAEAALVSMLGLMNEIAPEDMFFGPRLEDGDFGYWKMDNAKKEKGARSD